MDATPVSPAIPEPIDPVEFATDPLGCLARHREQHWWAPLGETGIREVLDHSSVRDLLGNEGALGAFLGRFLEHLAAQNPDIEPALLAAMRETASRSLINLDGEDHQRLRAIVGRSFTPRSVSSLRPYLGEYAAELAEELLPGEDFMRTFARRLPARALCALTGIPSEDQEQFINWIDVLEVQLSPPRLMTIGREESERVLEVHGKLQMYCADLVRERRANPRADLISRMAAETDECVDDSTIATLIADLIFAGNDTTRNALGLMVMTLAEQPATWETVAEDPSLAPSVVEEVLRLQSPAPGPVRVVDNPFTFRDHEFGHGDVAILSIWSANRDRAFWGDSADEFVPAREHAGEHMTFGHGRHYCLGAGLAREEMRAALVALTSQLRGVCILERPRMHPPGSIYGPVSLRLGFERR